MFKLIALFAIISLGIVLAGKLNVLSCVLWLFYLVEAGTNLYCIGISTFTNVLSRVYVKIENWFK